MAVPLPIRTRHAGVALRERLHHHGGSVGDGPVGGRGRGRYGEETPRVRARRGVPPVETDSRSGLQAVACAIQGRCPRSEGAAR